LTANTRSQAPAWERNCPQNRTEILVTRLLVPKLRLGNAIVRKAGALRTEDTRSQAPAWERNCPQSSGFAYLEI
jgi:hypothetical protein